MGLSRIAPIDQRQLIARTTMPSYPRALRRWDPATLAIVALTLVAFAIRVSGIDQSLYGDELLTLDDIDGGLSGLGDGLDQNEINPPLYFLAALAFAQLGDDTTLIRLPSILLGTATVPVVYALGRQVVGPAAGVVAAALVALSPFAAFYSVEARPYATMVFFVALSTLALLRAVEGGRPRWWALYALAAACAVYSHYTAMFIVGAQALWAVLAHRERLKALLAVYAVIAIAFLPWLPTFLGQRDQGLYTGVIGASVDLTVGTAFELVMRLFVGHPFRHLPIVPGDAALVLLAVAAGALVGVAALRLVRARPIRVPRPSSPLVLLLLTAAVVPVGLLLYGLVADDLYAARNLSASIPALAVLSAAALTAFGPRISGALVGLVLVAVLLALTNGLDVDQLRPQSRQVAQYLEREMPAGEPVLRGLGDVNALRVYLHGHPILNESGDDQPAWHRAATGGSTFLVRGEVGALALLPRFAGPAGRYELVESKQFPGLRRLGVGRYVGRVTARLESVGGRQVLALTPGPDIVITPGAVRGFQESVDYADGRLSVSGWGIAADHSRPADSLFVLDGDRVIAIASPTVLREDVAASFGRAVDACGFAVTTPAEHARELASSGRIRTFAAVGSRASELPPLR
jgi:hypothetical protein